MAEHNVEESNQLESNTVMVTRTSATVAGGRRMSFNSLVVVGDKNGRVGWGYGKALEVPTAIEKAGKAARRNTINVSRAGTTIHHEVEGRFGSAVVRLVPAAPGTGVVAGAAVRAVLEAMGISDCLTKCYGSRNKMNVVKAVFDGLKQLREPEDVADLRGKKLGQTRILHRIEKTQQMSGSAAVTENN
ncbi:MAG: 30S ribosomal protein S5 [Phycisphaeraceae bacterium]|nr:30S ribosomal protein S5 [Phycisphaerales bacterium]MCB9860291.1 30S ribosomal protein S5 [Phycisphaeraceae bacterium]